MGLCHYMPIFIFMYGLFLDSCFCHLVFDIQTFPLKRNQPTNMLSKFCSSNTATQFEPLKFLHFVTYQEPETGLILLPVVEGWTGQTNLKRFKKNLLLG